jgi:hypothetical protein
MATFWLGPAGGLVQVRAPSPDYTTPRIRLGGTHETLAGGLIRDTIGYRRTITLRLPPDQTAEQYSALEALYELPLGPYRYLDPTRRNLLTANQSSGTDAARDTTGLVVNTQGVISSSTAQAHSGTRSILWDTVTPLGATGRGVTFGTSSTGPDKTWAAVLPSTAYTLSMWARASAAVQMKSRIDYCDAAGTNLSTINGTPVTLSTSWQQITATGTSPSNVAYALARATNSDTPAGAVQVYLDDAQLEEGSTASTWVLGTGVPLMTIDSFEPDYSLYAADAAPPSLGAMMVLLEV